MNESQADQIFRQVDANNSGMIDFTEFVQAAISEKDLLSEQRLKNVFAMFDLDGNGRLSIDEIKSMLTSGQQ